MPAFLNGVPLHVLVVHAVVVLVPLAVLGCLTVAVWPAARRRYGWLVVGVTALAMAAVPLATQSGEDLRDRLSRTDLIRTHAELGDQLAIFVFGLLVAVAALVWLTRKPDRPKALVIGVAVATVVLAGVSAVQVVRIGDSGAKAAWSTQTYQTPQPRAHDRD